MKVTRTSPFSGIERTKDLNITEEQYYLWNNGMVAQRAFPQLSPADREFIISGITDEEWQEIFKDQE